jgi:S1-C subfamily serine protease
MIRIISLVTIVISMLSCTSATKNLSVSEILPRKGYVYIKKIVNLRRCTETACQTGSIAAAGSGFVLKVTHKGSFIMTAAHVCATNTAELLPGVQAIDHLKVQTLEGRYYDAKVLQVDREIDACMMFAEDLVDHVEEVKLAAQPPVEGDKIYNIASPYGIRHPNVVPIFEGRYIGERGFNGFYTFEAGPGSSGSMILNEEGELIGLLHSVYRDMHSVVVSVRYDSLMQFIRKGLIEHLTPHVREFNEYRSLVPYSALSIY